MQPRLLGDRFTEEELNILLNSWPTVAAAGHAIDQRTIAALDRLGRDIGYGALAQMAQWMYEIRCHGNQENAATLKRERFNALGWPLPEGFEQAAGK